MEKIKNNLILELHIPDFQIARDFYRIFGFEQVRYDPTSGGGSDLGYMVLRRQDALGETYINFYGDKEKVSQHAFFKNFPSGTRRGYEVEITIPVANVEEIWAEIKEKLKPEQIQQSLTLKRWGKKDFRIMDPFGFYIRFTELVDWY